MTKSAQEALRRTMEVYRNISNAQRQTQSRLLLRQC